MTLGTHVAFASVLYLGGATLFGYRPDAISWALAAIASLLPDVDLPPARIGRLFWFVAVCELSAEWSHFDFGGKEPLGFRRNGATGIFAIRSQADFAAKAARRGHLRGFELS